MTLFTSGSVQSVYLVDDDPGVRKALTRVLERKGWRVETFESAEAFLARSDPLGPGCLVLDVALPGLDGLELQRRIAEAGNALPIVFLTGHGDIPMSVRAIKAGAVDFLVKPVKAQALLGAVRAAVDQDASTRQERAGTAEVAQRLATLRPREREVLSGVAAGKLNKQIAADLGITEHTVKFHRARLMERMHAKTAADLIQIAAKLGIGANTSEPDLRDSGSPSDGTKG